MIDGFHFLGIGAIFVWLIFAVIAYLVYKDAEKRGLNGLLWGLPILVPWVGVIFLILYLVLREGGHRIAGSIVGRMGPEEILDERYAKGELTREQYVQMKDDIKKVP